MPGAIDYAALRTTMMALVRSFGKTVPMNIVRYVEGAAPDLSKPWRRDPATQKLFPFIGVSFTVRFPTMGDPTQDDDKTIIVPGDIVAQTATGDALTVCGDLQYTDRVLIGSIQYQILGKQDITPESLPIIYKLRARAWPRLSLSPPTQS